MPAEFGHSAKVKQCLIPLSKSGKPNDLLIFERGKNWAKADLANF
jgi:hypothetical protein